MSKQLVSYDEFTGIETWHDYDAASDTTVLHSVQRGLDEFIKRNKVLQNAGPEHFKHDKEFWHAAHIPNIIIMKWLNEDGLNFYDPAHWEGIKRKLNSSEYAYLRTGLFNI